MADDIRFGRFPDDDLPAIAESLLRGLKANPDECWAQSGGWLVMAVHDDDGERVEYFIAKVVKTVDA